MEMRKLAVGFLYCALAAALTEFLTFGQPQAMPLLGLTGQIIPGKAPGAVVVTDHAIRQAKQRGKLIVDVNLNYPSFGHAAIDADIQHWVTGIADAFEENLADDLADGGAASPGGREAEVSFALHGSYTITRPSDAAVSLTFELWTYTGGAHGNLDIITLNYSLLTGQRLELVDLFEEPDTALRLMSEWSFQVLSRRFAGAWALQMLKNGTSPDAQNFASLTLTPEGVVIQFQPYQVAPWSAGAQTVEISYDKLTEARPLAAVWGR